MANERLIPYPDIPTTDIGIPKLKENTMLFNENFNALEQALNSVESLVAELESGKADSDHSHDEYAETGHLHAMSAIDGLTEILDNKAPLIHEHSQYLVEVPIHSHTMNDVSGLIEELAGKSADGHSHLMSEIDGLSQELSSKASIAQLDGAFGNVVTRTTEQSVSGFKDFTNINGVKAMAVQVIGQDNTIWGLRGTGDTRQGFSILYENKAAQPVFRASDDSEKIYIGNDDLTDEVWIYGKACRYDSTASSSSETTSKEIATCGWVASNFSTSGHTHSGYALTDHTHSGYALTDHTHSGYALTDHTHSDYALSSAVDTINQTLAVLGDLNAYKTTIDGYVTSAVDSAQTQIGEILESIPPDYTEMVDEVSAIDADLYYGETKLFVDTTTNQTVAGVKTFSDNIIAGNSLAIKRTDNTSLLELEGGSEWNNGGRLLLYGNSDATSGSPIGSKGGFRLTASTGLNETSQDGTPTEYTLTGYSQTNQGTKGRLQWTGNSFFIGTQNSVYGWGQYGNSSIELFSADTSTNGGYIDFHYSGSTSDYTARIIGTGGNTNNAMDPSKNGLCIQIASEYSENSVSKYTQYAFGIGHMILKDANIRLDASSGKTPVIYFRPNGSSDNASFIQDTGRGSSDKLIVRHPNKIVLSVVNGNTNVRNGVELSIKPDTTFSSGSTVVPTIGYVYDNCAAKSHTHTCENITDLSAQGFVTSTSLNTTLNSYATKSWVNTQLGSLDLETLQAEMDEYCEGKSAEFQTDIDEIVDTAGKDISDLIDTIPDDYTELYDTVVGMQEGVDAILDAFEVTSESTSVDVVTGVSWNGTYLQYQTKKMTFTNGLLTSIADNSASNFHQPTVISWS